MLPYITLVLILIPILILSKLRRKTILLAFILLGLFSGFRYYVGIDFKNYVSIYQWTVEGHIVTSEPLFIYFIQLCDYFGGDYQLFFLITSLLISILVCCFVLKNSKDVVMSFLLYLCVVSFYLYSFNAVRQWVACSFFLYSLSFLVDKEYRKYLILNTFAALCFHTSLFFIFPLVLFLGRNVNFKTRLIGYAGALVLGLTSSIILSNTHYDSYKEADFDSYIDFKIYIFLIISCFIELYRKRFFNFEERKERIFMNINYFSILILIALILQSSGTLILLFKRIHNYFFAVYIVLIPFLFFKYYRNRHIEKLTRNIIYLLLLILFFVTIYFNGEQIELIPYNYNLNTFR